MSVKMSRGVVYAWDGLAHTLCDEDEIAELIDIGMVGKEKPSVEIIPEGAKVLVDGLFLMPLPNCWVNSTLKKIILPDGLEEIGNCCFWSCDEIEKFDLPESIRKIGANAFRYCDGITEITIPEGVTEILEGTFCGCMSLETVCLPRSLSFIGNAAFEECESLGSIQYNGTVEEWNAIEKYEELESDFTCVTVVCSDGEISY